MIRVFEAGLATVIILLVLVQFVTLSAGRLGEQWDSTELDVEIKKALAEYQTPESAQQLSQYSKLRDPEMLRMPEDEGIGYRILIDGQPIGHSAPTPNVEVATSDARVFHQSRDAARLVRTFHQRLFRSDYVQIAGKMLDYNSVDELADLILGIAWDEESADVLEDRVRTLRQNQNDDGGWGFVLDDESDTLCTSMAVRAISAWLRRLGAEPLSDPDVVEGISWLKSGVHADGGYGGRERLESATDMTAHVVLAFVEAGLDPSDAHLVAAVDFILSVQNADGGFPIQRRGPSDPASTALALEALMSLHSSEPPIEAGAAYMESQMVDDGDFTFDFDTRGELGAYVATIDSGYAVDCSIRGYEFWGEGWDDSAVAIFEVYGDRNNMTVVLRIQRSILVPPENKQKVTLCFSHNATPDTEDLWILNAGNPHTAGQGVNIDDPKFGQEVIGIYTYLTITNLVVPMEYDFFTPTADYLIAIVGDVTHPIKDNPGRGYLIGYWGIWMAGFDFGNILVWRSLGSPRADRLCLDVDYDAEFDDRRLTNGDTVWAYGYEWITEIDWDTKTEDVNYVRFYQPDLNLVRYYYTQKYDLSSIPEPLSGLYRFGVISVYNKPSFTRDYKVILRDSTVEDLYDEAYLFDGTSWLLLVDGSIWNEGGESWIAKIEGDFLVLTHAVPQTFTLSGTPEVNLSLEGDFLEVCVDPNDVGEVSVRILSGAQLREEAIFSDVSQPKSRLLFGTWGVLRDTSKVYHSLSIVEQYLSTGMRAVTHEMTDKCQLSIKFEKAYNSVVESLISVEAWFRSET